MAREYEFVEPPPKQFQFECPVCLKILHEPRLISCCGCNVCAACIGRVDHAGRSTGVATGEIRGVEDGKLYATGSTTCIIMKLR